MDAGNITCLDDHLKRVGDAILELGRLLRDLREHLEREKVYLTEMQKIDDFLKTLFDVSTEMIMLRLSIHDSTR